MPGIERLEHIDRLRRTDFADDNTVRAHPEGRFDQIADRYRSSPFHIRVPRLKPYQVRNILNP